MEAASFACRDRVLDGVYDAAYAPVAVTDVYPSRVRFGREIQRLEPGCGPCGNGETAGRPLSPASARG